MTSIIISVSLLGIIIVSGSSVKHTDNIRFSQNPTCNPPDAVGIYSFPLPATYTDSAQQPRNIASAFIRFNSNRPINSTISATSYYDLTNRIRPNQADPAWEQFSCTELNGIEPECRNPPSPGGRPFSRGHLVPKCSERYSATAYANTFKCVNQLPQIQNQFNDAAWAAVEECSIQIASDSNIVPGTTGIGAVIMTGVCETELQNPPIPAPNSFIPSCFWKLVCYRNGTNTFVAGFHGLNVAQPSEIANSILGQQAILDRLSPYYGLLISNTWAPAHAAITVNRETVATAPNPQDCRTALTLPPAELARLKYLRACRIRNLFDESQQCEDECFCDNTNT